MEKKKRIKILRRIGRVLLVLIVLFVALVLFIRSPWSQDIMVAKATDYVSKKTGTKVEIERLFLTFSGNLSLEGLYLEDKKGDTLVYSKALEADLGLSQLLFGNEFDLEYLEWEGLKANVTRQEGSEDFNFSFLIDAFVSQDSVPAPESASEPMEISVGTIDLKDFDIVYDDGFMGIDSKLRLGRLYAEANTIDLEAMRFELEDLELTDSEAVYKQTKPFPQTGDTTETALPFLAVENFTIEKVKVNYNSMPDSLSADVNIGHFLLEMPKADLAKNDITVDVLELKNSDISLRMVGHSEQPADTVTVTDSGFEWPEFLVQVDKIDFQDNTIAYTAGNNQPEAGKFNSDAVAISNLRLQANDILYRPKKANFVLEKLAFAEKSGFQLKNFAFEARLEDNNAALSGLQIQTNNSSVSGDISLVYASVDELIQTPENARIKLNIPNLNLALQDAYVFQPDLANNEYVKKAAKKPVTGSLQANGTLASIQIPNLEVDWGENTSLAAKGQLNNVTEPNALYFDFNTIRAKSVRKDVLRFVSEDSLGISVPKTIVVDASAKGSVDDMAADILLKIPEGTAQLTGTYSDQQKIAFDGTLKVDSLRLDKLLKNEQLGDISFTLNASGKGSDLNTLDATLASDFSQLQLNDYDFSGLDINGSIVDGRGDINLDFKDQNLNVGANTKIELDSVRSHIVLDLNVEGADLKALGVTEKNIKVGTELRVNFTGSSEDYTFEADVAKGIAVIDNNQYQMDDVRLRADIDPKNTNVSISSTFLNGELVSNTSPNGLTAALQKQFRGYFSESVERDTTSQDPVNLEFDLTLTPTPILTEVFLQGVERLDSLSVYANFNSMTKKLNADLFLPAAMYNGISVDSLAVSVKGTATDLDFSAGFGGLVADPINIKKTYLVGNLTNNELLLDLISYDGEEKLVHIASEMVLAKDTVKLHIDPTALIFNEKEWLIPQDNQIVISENYLNFKNIDLSRNEQQLSIGNSVSGIEKEHIGITFENFRVQTLLSLLNPDEALASGQVNGNFAIVQPFGATGIVADFNIKNLGVLQTELGDLTMDASSKGLSEYDFDMAIKEGRVDLDLTGDFTAAETGAKLNLDLNLNKLELGVLQELSDGAIEDTEGFLSGNVSVSGTTASPNYDGNLAFNQTRFKVADLNAVFKISDETLQIDNSGIYFDTFEIVDTNGSVLTLDGSVMTENLTNPTFDFTLNTEAFRILDSTKDDNELYYGIVSVDADLDVKGNLNLPKVDGKLRVRKITDVTYVVPESQLDVQERDGVVIFVNRQDPDAILTRNDQEETPSMFKGFDVNTVLEIADDAVFHIIIDQQTGDNLQVSGDAELNLDMNPNGNISLTGRYELSSGHYETSLYNLVSRKFRIKPGGTITWQGDPMDAALDVTAIYDVETSAAPLMAAVTSGQDVSVTGKYQQVLPFLVYLNVGGELLEPELSFDLEMPEDAQGSLGGAVYGRVRQLNEQESALNKQVFSLLALNRFYPSPGSDGSSGGTAALARDNVNKVLSGQLNTFSDKIFGNSGFQVDFDLDSFTDYQGEAGPQDRTQLNINAKKKLFDDRLVVTAGSAVDVAGSTPTDQGQTPIIGNVSLEYLLTEDGRYRLKGFRKNEYENVIDGQLIVTGLALIFNREFNKFSQLFNPLKDNDVNEENTKGGDKSEDGGIKDQAKDSENQ